MRTKQEIKELIALIEVPKWSDEEKEKIVEHIFENERRIEAFVNMHTEPLKNALKITKPITLHGLKFSGGKRGSGQKAKEWKKQLADIAYGLTGNKLNLSNILNRIEKAIDDNNEFWESVDRKKELVFFDINFELKSIKFKTIYNEITSLKKVVHSKAT